MSDVKKVMEGIQEGVTSGYTKIERAVVGGYKQVENAAVSAYKAVEDRFVDRFLTHEGETVDEAKARLAAEEKECRRMETEPLSGKSDKTTETQIKP